MFDFHEKRKMRSILYSKPIIALLFGLAILLSFSVYNRYTVAVDMEAKLDAKHVELNKLKERAQVLQAKVDFLENDRGVEEELRNRFDVAREGEKVIILLDSKDGQNKAGQNLPVVQGSGFGEAPKGFFSRLKFW